MGAEASQRARSPRVRHASSGCRPHRTALPLTYTHSLLLSTVQALAHSLHCTGLQCRATPSAAARRLFGRPFLRLPHSQESQQQQPFPATRQWRQLWPQRQRQQPMQPIPIHHPCASTSRRTIGLCRRRGGRSCSSWPPSRSRCSLHHRPTTAARMRISILLQMPVQRQWLMQRRQRSQQRQ